MNSEYKYEVRGYRKQADVHSFGSSVEIGCDTLKEAKTKARFILTEQERELTESSQCLGYSQVVNRYTGEVLHDCFNNSICQECGQKLPHSQSQEHKVEIHHACPS